MVNQGRKVFRSSSAVIMCIKGKRKRKKKTTKLLDERVNERSIAIILQREWSSLPFPVLHQVATMFYVMASCFSSSVPSFSSF